MRAQPYLSLLDFHGGLRLGLLASFFTLFGPQLWLPAQDEGGKGEGQKQGEEAARAKPAYDLVGWGQLKPVKGNEGFFEFACTAREKGRWRKLKTFVKLSDDLKVLADSRVELSEFKKDDKVYALGKNREDTSVSPMGLSVTYYRIIGVQALLRGKGIQVNKEYRDRKDKAVRWLDMLVETNDGQLEVTFFEQKGYRVEVSKRTLLLSRMPAEASLITSNSKGLYAFVLGKKSDERPDTGRKSDAKKPVFSTTRVIVLDPVAVKLGLYQKLYN
ncbi:MAG: hypothetical protein VYB34_05105 [Planctomycetota bacterium]|mgnify:CR=1 FL=1|nr:hypothetical protein [Planctomycetota bacterium]